MPKEKFGTVHDRKFQNRSDIKKTAFLDLNSTAKIRILDEEYFSELTHYVNRSTVRCLGDNCPICASNKSIIMQNGDGYKTDPRYSPRRSVYMVNVLDKSPVRICQTCNEESRVTGTTSVCKKCQAILTSDQVPSNKVKVLSRGVTLFEQLGSIESAVLDDKGEKIGLVNFDLTLVVNGTGKDKTITPIPGAVSPAQEVSQDDLFDLSKVVIELTPSEMLDLQRGVSMRDIFAARRAGQEMESGGASSVDSALASMSGLDDSASAAIDELFKTRG